jgi:two-component sensor histidine kinase
MTSVPDRREREAIDRPLGWLIAIGGCILILDQMLAQMPAAPAFAAWWNLGATLVAVFLVALAVAGLYLPLPVLDVVWRAVPATYACLQATWPLGLAGGDIERVVPWLWTLEPAVITLLLLVTRPAVAIALGVSLSLVPGLSGLLVVGHVPRAVLIDTPAQLSNVLYLVIFVALRTQLRRLYAAEQTTRFQRAEQVRAAALLEQQVALQRVVHDEVLSVLTSAMLVSGTPSEVLRQDARRAVAVLQASEAPPPATSSLVDDQDAVALIVADLRRIDPAVRLDIQSGPAQLPLHVATGVGRAAAEALRNSIRHAGAEATRSVRIRAEGHEVEVTVRDDGVGFDLGLAGRRLGIVESIVGRMGDLGGSARIDSAPGVGTEVVLAWTG